jgi:lipopolysaccharide transport system ATP-binding protein
MSEIKLANVSLKFPITFSDKSLRNNLYNFVKKKNEQFNFKSCLKNINLSIKDGDRVGILGENGSGKSTLLRIISGIYTPDSGTVNVIGKVLAVHALNTGIDMESSGEENIYNISFMRGIKKNEIDQKIQKIIDYSELGSSIFKPLRTYSSGMIARLSSSMLVTFESEILILDEFISTGDDNFKKKLRESILKKIESSNIFVFASHDKELVNSICNKKILLKYGEIINE